MGVETIFYPSGRIWAVTSYKNGLREGEEKIWYENGNLRSKCFYHKNMPNGLRTRYYSNGQIQVEYSYMNGYLHGVAREWREDGTLSCDGMYTQGCFTTEYNGELLLLSRGELNAKEIMFIEDVGVRIILLQKLGYERLSTQMDYAVVDKSGEHELIRIDQFNDGDDDRIYLVKVKCPSSRAFYTLRVPPEAKTVKEAVAWTFGMQEGEYNPYAES